MRFKTRGFVGLTFALPLATVFSGDFSLRPAPLTALRLLSDGLLDTLFAISVREDLPADATAAACERLVALFPEAETLARCVGSLLDFFFAEPAVLDLAGERLEVVEPGRFEDLPPIAAGFWLPFLVAPCILALDLLDWAFPVPDGAFAVPDGAFAVPDGAFAVPDGAFAVPEWAFPVPDGVFLVPDGDLLACDLLARDLGGVVPLREWAGWIREALATALTRSSLSMLLLPWTPSRLAIFTRSILEWDLRSAAEITVLSWRRVDARQRSTNNYGPAVGQRSKGGFSALANGSSTALNSMARAAQFY
jgi:hypothetical protein